MIRPGILFLQYIRVFRFGTYPMILYFLSYDSPISKSGNDSHFPAMVHRRLRYFAKVYPATSVIYYSRHNFFSLFFFEMDSQHNYTIPQVLYVGKLKKFSQPAFVSVGLKGA